MSKNLVSIPEGNLMRVAASRNVATLTALHEKTGVDRKTLRAINSGRPVKDTTLQNIANKLRVPLPHLLGPKSSDKTEDEDAVDAAFEYIREIKLERLNASSLRELASETDEINWSLKIDKLSEELEALLL